MPRPRPSASASGLIVIGRYGWRALGVDQCNHRILGRVEPELASTDGGGRLAGQEFCAFSHSGCVQMVRRAHVLIAKQQRRPGWFAWLQGPPAALALAIILNS